MHPLISAYLALKEEGIIYREWRSHRSGPPMYYAGDWTNRVEWYYELVASCFVPKILVGFGTWQYRYRPFVRFWDNTSLFTGDDI